MKILTYQGGNTLKLGIQTASGVINVAAATQNNNIPTSPNAFYSMGLAALDDMAALAASNIDAEYMLDENSLTLGPCVPNPGKI